MADRPRAITGWLGGHLVRTDDLSQHGTGAMELRWPELMLRTDGGRFHVCGRLGAWRRLS
ncbi:hypothetical protein E2562_033045 [Oryza meyeriana var. granulata]|uniref:Uncharacterized protein n=1 Tax=Oryza meyeriana var. granulata TaxID=110450 RepID=A0A6G1CJC9_9ORYZ|nr:hypothetical protein E2562_033045 [Oryza meyeriana var. granulata]